MKNFPPSLLHIQTYDKFKSIQSLVFYLFHFFFNSTVYFGFHTYCLNITWRCFIHTPVLPSDVCHLWTCKNVRSQKVKEQHNHRSSWQSAVSCKSFRCVVYQLGFCDLCPLRTTQAPAAQRDRPALNGKSSPQIVIHSFKKNIVKSCF